ncbi:uncharacterized protein LOC114322280 isoform X1 [Camellia sinensis]|uniref:uncharacterized protein LOC114322280 isoform X1 n=1 Tax=Camellia sinensis TaxID=4442 RepID=UPI00103558EB|nr:uncharacterized protein LOC114322280 isoform X1 [Camellia sinensis]
MVTCNCYSSSFATSAVLPEGSLWFQQKSIFRNSDDGGNRINCFPDSDSSSHQSISWRESDTLHSLTFINCLCIVLWLGMGFLGTISKRFIWSHLCPCQTCCKY